MKKGRHFWLFAILLIFVIISGYGMAKYYQGLKYPVHVSEPVWENDAEKELYLHLREVANLEKLIEEIDQRLADILEQNHLLISKTSEEIRDWEIYENINLQWNEKSIAIEVPTFARVPKEIDEVKLIIETVLDMESTFLNSNQNETEDIVEETISIGLSWKDREIVTHQFKLVKKKPKARLAIIIDDLGYSWSEFETMMTIPRPMTFAVLPELSGSEEQAKRVLKEKYHLILHQPMEAVSSIDPGPGAILTTMSEEEIVKTLDSNLEGLPEGIIGVNNHMGSKATADSRVMEIILRYLKDRDLFFIDSSTAPNSVVPSVAKQVGEAYAKNYIFIDNVNEIDVVKEYIRKAGQLALKNGQAITIGHVKQFTGKAILEMIDELESLGIQIVYVKDLLK
ncbi:MAG: divergent polysaccharide deacetylase family protein [Halanaerobiales bacterium]|nr:divergent polysaccharide deacetylase family protein [Halanaerobiales bacterium]